MQELLLAEIGCDALTEVGQATSEEQLVGQVRKERFSDWNESSCVWYRSYSVVLGGD